MTFSSLTVIIPTHERHNFLRRSLDYWRDFPARIIIIDSSVEPFNSEAIGRFDYRHVPGMDYSEKLHLAVGQVETEHCVMCADDDFLSFSALEEAIAFLGAHKDFASVQGYCLTFQHCDKVEYAIGYPHIHEYAIVNEDPAARMAGAMRNYMHQFYAVHHTENLRLTTTACRGVHNGTAVEATFVLVPMMRGKHQVLPIFYVAREILPTTGIYIPLLDWMGLAGSKEEASLWRKRLADTFVKITGQPLGSGLAAVDEALKAIGDCCAQRARSRESRRWKEYVRLFMPAWLLKARRRHFLREKLPQDSPRWAADACAIYDTKYKNIPGYPWSDPAVAVTWGRMLDIIRRYGPLKGVRCS